MFEGSVGYIEGSRTARTTNVSLFQKARIKQLDQLGKAKLCARMWEEPVGSRGYRRVYT